MKDSSRQRKKAAHMLQGRLSKEVEKSLPFREKRKQSKKVGQNRNWIEQLHY